MNLTKSLINIYNEVQKVRYQIIDIDYTFENSLQLIENNEASCTPKHIVLFEKFRALGLETKYLIHEFEWDELNVSFPAKLSKFFKLFSRDYHTNIEVKINNKWIMVDATWNNQLINAGLPKTKDWDGLNSTVNAVKSIKVKRFDSLNERNIYLKKNDFNQNEHQGQKIKFIEELNVFLNTL